MPKTCTTMPHLYSKLKLHISLEHLPTGSGSNLAMKTLQTEVPLTFCLREREESYQKRHQRFVNLVCTL